MVNLILSIYSFLFPLSGLINQYLGYKFNLIIYFFLFILSFLNAKESRKNNLDYLTIIFFIVIGFSYLTWWPINKDSFTIGFNYFYCASFPFLIYFLNFKRLIKTFTLGFTLGCLILSLTTITYIFLGIQDGIIIDKGFESFIFVNIAGWKNPSAAAAVIVLGIACLDTCFQNKNNYRIIYYLTFALFLVTLLATYSRAGLISFLVYLFFSRKIFKQNIWKLVLYLLIAIIITYLIFDISNFLVDSFSIENLVFSNKEGSNVIRSDLYRLIPEAIFSAPFFGIGVGNINNFVYSRVGWFNQFHNFYIGMLLEIGYLPLLSLCILIYRQIRNFYKTIKDSKSQPFLSLHLNSYLFSIYTFWLLHEFSWSCFWFVYSILIAEYINNKDIKNKLDFGL